MACYINQRSHFGVTVTSPIEGCHATIKAFLQRGHSDLKGVFDKLKLFWAEQHASIQSTVAQQQLRPKHSVNVPLFAAVLKQVHGYALERILKELKKLPAKGHLLLVVPAQFNSRLAFPATIYTLKTRKSRRDATFPH